MNHHLTSLACLLSASLTAQVTIGDIAVTGFSSSAFGVIETSLAVTTYTTGGFQGTGTSQTILWDRANPNDFLVGGIGFVGRATLVGPGTVSYALLTSNVGIVSQMSWDDGGQIVFVDSGSNQVRRLDPISGVITDLSFGTQPWGSSLAAGAWDPITGDVVVGGSGAVYRLANGGSVGTLIAGGLGGFVGGIAFDPTTGEILATVLTANRLVRIDANGAVTDVVPAGSLPGPNALVVDQNGDFVAGGGTGQVYRVAHAGGTPTFLANYSGPLNGLAVAGSGGYGIAFGHGCMGASGVVALTATGPFLVGSTVTTTSTNHAANALGLLVLGLSNTTYAGLPLPFLLDPVLGTANCQLHTSVDATLSGLGGAGNPATLTFSFTLPPSFSGYRFFAQHACLDPVPGNLSWSNGLAFQVP